MTAQQVLIVGPPGVGKSTLSRELSRRTGLPSVELDDLRLAPGWQHVPDDAFRAAVEAVVARPEWILSGNYAGVRDLTWSRSDIVVWLDLPLRTVMLRLIGRTARRIASGEKVGSGNRESLRRVLSRRSIVLWAWRSHGPLRSEYERSTAVYSGRVPVVRLTSASAQRAWLAQARAAQAGELATGEQHGLICPTGA